MSHFVGVCEQLWNVFVLLYQTLTLTILNKLVLVYSIWSFTIYMTLGICFNISWM